MPPTSTPGEQGGITYACWVGPPHTTTRIDEVLGLVDLTYAAERRVDGYSLGMRQRLGLAGALLGDPELLILDEPANGLDPEGMRWLRDFLRDFAAQGKTVFVSSHHLAEVAELVDHVIIINHGRLVVEAPLDELTERGAAIRVETTRSDALEVALRDAVLRASDARTERFMSAGSPLTESEESRWRRTSS